MQMAFRDQWRGSVRERFRRAESKGWFFAGAGYWEYPLNMTDTPLPRATGTEKYLKAAVLFLIGCKAQSSQLQVLITKRSTKVGSHPGEYCLPGGMQDSAADKNLVDTALREANEEIGLDGRHVEVVCTLPPFPSGWQHTILVTPVVALLHLDIEQLQMRENEEVERTLWVPLNHVIINDYYTHLRRPWRETPTSVSTFRLKEPSGNSFDLWGLTATICIAASSIALGELPHFPSLCEVVWKVDDQLLYLTELAPTSNLYTPLQLRLTSKL